MSDLTQMEATIFEAALEISDPEQRRAMLDVACQNNPELRRRIDELLVASDDAAEFMQQPAAEFVQTVAPFDMDEQPGASIGRYKLLEQIGEGGFGVVYMADQVDPIERRVALKIIKQGMDTKQVIARFEAERQALALMDHPNIAKILDAGTTDTGRPYFVMELVRGIPVTEYCDDRGLQTAERLQIFSQVCSAVQHAHQKGIIHRDIKPSNILVSTNGDEAVPKVIDFGIAKATQGRLTDKTLFTQFRQFIGTPAYMSPEQAQMSAVDVDTRSDIYSLGVLLYELLTGKTPLDSQSLINVGYEEICRRIREEEAQKPSKRLSSLQHEELTTLAKQRNVTAAQFPATVRGDLDWIVMKAVEKDRSRRYDSCGALTLDIQRYLADEPVSAGPPSAFYHLKKFIHRNRVAALTAMVVAASMILGTAVALTGWMRAIDERDKQERANRNLTKVQAELADKVVEAKAAQLLAENEKQRARRLAYASDMNGVNQALKLNNLGLARQLIERNQPYPDGTDLRNWDWRALKKMSQSDAIAMFGGGGWAIKSLSVTANGKWVATGSNNGGIQVWDVEKRSLTHTLHDSSINQYGFVGFSPAGDRLFATTDSGVVNCWSVPSFEKTNDTFEHADRVRDLALSPDGNFLAVYDGASGDGINDRVTVWDLKTNSKRFTNNESRGGGVQEGRVAFTPDSKTLVVGAAEQSLIIDVPTGSVRATIPQNCKYGLAFTPDSKILASGRTITDPAVYLYRLSDGELIDRLDGHSLYLQNVAISPDGKQLASASADQTVRLWDLQTGRPTSVLRGHQTEVWSLQFTTDGKRLITGDKNGLIGIWDPQANARSDWPSRLDIGGYDASFSFDGQFLATRNEDDSVSFRSAETLEEVSRLACLGTKNRGIRFSNVELLLAAGDSEGNVVFLNPQRPDLRRTFQLFADAEISPANFSAQGDQLLLLAKEEVQTQCILWSLKTNKELKRFPVPSRPYCASLSPDARFIVTGHEDQALLWDVKTGKSRVLLSEIQVADAAAWSPDGLTLAIGMWSGQAQLFDVANSFSPKGRLRGHMMAVHGITFSPDGSRIATSGGPGETLKIWDAATNQELLGMNVDGYFFQHVEFSPDSNAVMVIGGGGNLNVWRVPPIENSDHSTEMWNIDAH